jgi:hypothetical protein
LQSLTISCIRYRLGVATDDAVELMLAISAGEIDETEVADWLTERLQAFDSA